MRMIMVDKKPSSYAYIHDTCMIVHHSKYSIESYDLVQYIKIPNELDKIPQLQIPQQANFCYLCNE
jgi:hypothetical protein